jgi:hypothetical protein
MALHHPRLRKADITALLTVAFQYYRNKTANQDLKLGIGK